MKKMEKLTFNKWSQERIKQGRKICTSRKRIWNDPRVYIIIKLSLETVKKRLWIFEGADSPEEFEKVWRSICRGKFNPKEEVYVHFGKFGD